MSVEDARRALGAGTPVELEDHIGGKWIRVQGRLVDESWSDPGMFYFRGDANPHPLNAFSHYGRWVGGQTPPSLDRLHFIDNVEV